MQLAVGPGTSGKHGFLRWIPKTALSCSFIGSQICELGIFQFTLVADENDDLGSLKEVLCGFPREQDTNKNPGEQKLWWKDGCFFTLVPSRGLGVGVRAAEDISSGGDPVSWPRG